MNFNNIQLFQSNMEAIERVVNNSKEAEERALDVLSQEFIKGFFKLWYF